MEADDGCGYLAGKRKGKLCIGNEYMTFDEFRSFELQSKLCAQAVKTPVMLYLGWFGALNMGIYLATFPSPKLQLAGLHLSYEPDSP